MKSQGGRVTENLVERKKTSRSVCVCVCQHDSELKWEKSISTGRVTKQAQDSMLKTKTLDVKLAGDIVLGFAIW